MRGGIKWQIQHNVKPSAVFDMRPSTSNTVFFCTSRVNSALIDLVYCVEGSAVAVVMNPKRDAYKQIEAIVGESLLPKEYEMKYIRYKV